jgi:hypothetical protein
MSVTLSHAIEVAELKSAAEPLPAGGGVRNATWPKLIVLLGGVASVAWMGLLVWAAGRLTGLL